MDRKIKFRAWDNEKKEMYYSEWESAGYFIMFGKDNKLCIKVPSTGGGRKLENYELMQYTGLQDKKNVDIYEGDILKRIGGIEPKFEVLWNEKEVGFVFQKVDGEQREIRTYTSDELEVVGNVYENPELLSPDKRISGKCLAGEEK